MALLQKLGTAGLGVAQGTIIINTAQLRGAAAVARNVGNQIRSGLASGTAAAQQQAGAFGVLRGELVRLSLATAGFFAVGSGAAAYYEEAMVVLTGMTRSQTKAVELNEKIRDTARGMGVAYGEVLHATRLILPTMEGQTDQLEEQWQLIRRVAVLNPAQGMAMAAFAVNEALVSGGRDLMSLAERFNVSRGIFREEFAKSNRDFWGALDTTLTRMGITAEVADEMAGTFTASFNIARDAVTQLVAAGFEPLLQYLNPLLRMAADWAAGARESHSTTLAWAAALSTLAAVAIPTLGIMVKLGGAIKGLAGMSIMGPAGLGAGLGAGLAFGAIRVAGGAMGDERWQNYGLAEFTSDLKQAIADLIFTFNDLSSLMDRAVTDMVMNWYDMWAQMHLGLANFLMGLADLLPGGPWKGLLADAGVNYSKFGELSGKSMEAEKGFQGREARRWGFVGNMMEWLYPPSKNMEFGERGPVGEFGQAQLDAIEKWAEEVQSIEDKANDARLKATEQYESQRTKAVRDYAQQRAREEEDFARSRARQNADHLEDVAEVREDAGLREAGWWEDYYDSQTEQREDAAEKYLEIEEDYQKDREKLLTDHREKLLKAAARLDAAAVAEEQRRFAISLNNLEENYNDENAKVRDKLKEQEEDALEALEKRIQRGREEDERRLQDMEEDLAKRQAREDEDRAIRRERQNLDHAQSMADMELQYIEKMAAINEQAEKERVALDAKFQAEMYQLNLFNLEYMAIQKAQQDASIALWKDYWTDWYKSIEEAKEAERVKAVATIVAGGGIGRGFAPEQFQTGGPVNRTGLALVHAGEYVLNPATVRALRNSKGGSFTQGDILNRGINIEQGAIQIYGAVGQDVNQLGQIVRAELIAALQYAG